MKAAVDSSGGQWTYWRLALTIPSILNAHGVSPDQTVVFRPQVLVFQPKVVFRLKVWPSDPSGDLPAQVVLFRPKFWSSNPSFGLPVQVVVFQP